jgi:hypothetical protein
MRESTREESIHGGNELLRQREAVRMWRRENKRSRGG